LILWLFIVPVANSFLSSSTHFTRFVIVFPALALVAALGVRAIVELLLASSSLHRWKPLVMILLAGVLTLTQVNYYFNVYLPAYGVRVRNPAGHLDVEDAIQRSLNFPTGSVLYIVSPTAPNEPYNNAILHFFRTDLQLQRLTFVELLTSYPTPLACGVDHAFFVDPSEKAVIALLQRMFNLQPVRWSPYADILPDQQFALYYAPYLPGENSFFNLQCVARGQISK
jgi:hypothetical protein